MTIPLADVDINIPDGHNNEIDLDGNVGIKMKYPSLDEFVKNNFDMEGGMDVEDTFNLVASCIDQIYSEEESWPASESTKKELVDFIDQLGTKQFKEVENFFATMPKLSHTLKVTNPKTKVENEILLEGLQSFFG